MNFDKDMAAVPDRLLAECRHTDKGGEKWYSLKDVCEALELTNSSRFYKLLDNDEKDHIPISSKDKIGRQSVKRLDCVSESGVMSLMGSSKKKEAVEYINWICSVVLPGIRKESGLSVEEFIKKVGQQ